VWPILPRAYRARGGISYSGVFLFADWQSAGLAEVAA
jgi:hypothetical protein